MTANGNGYSIFTMISDLFHALMNVLHDNYHPDWDQRLGEKIMLVVSGNTGIPQIILPANTNEAVQALRDQQQTLLHMPETISCLSLTCFQSESAGHS